MWQACPSSLRIRRECRAARRRSSPNRVGAMAEAFATVDGIELCYEEFGDPADPAVLLVMGLATQMLGWHEDFCADLAGRGFRVIRYDNRDIVARRA